MAAAISTKDAACQRLKGGARRYEAAVDAAAEDVFEECNHHFHL